VIQIGLAVMAVELVDLFQELLGVRRPVQMHGDEVGAQALDPRPLFEAAAPQRICRRRGADPGGQSTQDWPYIDRLLHSHAGLTWLVRLIQCQQHWHWRLTIQCLNMGLQISTAPDHGDEGGTGSRMG
jgi:hypothetical protein